MFKIELIYNILHKNLLNPLNLTGFYFPSGSVNFDDLKVIEVHDPVTNECAIDTFTHKCLFYDQEPFYVQDFLKIFQSVQSNGVTTEEFVQLKEKYGPNAAPYNLNWRTLFNEVVLAHKNLGLFEHRLDYFYHRLNIIAHSDICTATNNLFKDFNMYSWYFFYHGFVALDWFNNIQYTPPTRKFDKVFITFNNVISGNRNYRLNLVSRILEKKLENFGYISLNNKNVNEIIKQEIFKNSLLSSESKKLIFKNLYKKNLNFVIDQKQTSGTLSAFDDVNVLSLGFLHLVTETIFYEDKLHLTEKIFKPIVSKRPFMLVGAVGNLSYLKSYGFKTFSKWIDESYDNEADPDKRIDMILKELEKLCNYTNDQLQVMYDDMMEILNFNFNHFYTNFKSIIVDELVDNFERILIKYNAGKDKSFDNYLDYSKLDLDQIKNILKS